ncbi:hypothetical protein SCLCIDRAFT_17106 [Scleroderma citrinum Foug A]|uniref:Uncharacterized protein n=1 Tax=Scleroderma citrinum Foug A TaxID=1036808 RepID=A0A0C3DKK4_9AGAM|nr:hypothetical protein SCLCIDRAFT_17106 [Scleroderma citrinum Foug A]
MTTSATAKMLPLFHGDYSDKEEPAHWFAQFQLALPDLWPEATKVQWFRMQLAPRGYTDEWFDALTTSECASVAAIRTRARWSKVQQKERVRDQSLKEEEIGKWIQEGRVGDYGQNVWAERVMKLALSMGDADGTLIEYAIKMAPPILRNHLEEGYDSWEEFIQAVRNIPAVKLRHSREDLEKERTQDSAIAVLRQQVTQLTVWASVPSYQASPRVSPTSLPYTNAVSGTATPSTPQGAAWHRTYGSDTTPSLKRPYPLKPGMAALGSGECFVCRMVTDLPHIGGVCQAAEPLKPLESRWRQLVAGMLRRAMSPRPPVSQVQYVWPMTQLHPAVSMLAPVLVHAVGAYEDDTSTGDNYGFKGDGYTEVPWDWVTASENGGGLRQPADQQ